LKRDIVSVKFYGQTVYVSKEFGEVLKHVQEKFPNLKDITDVVGLNMRRNTQVPSEIMFTWTWICHRH